MRRARGMSLIELMVAITVLSIAIGMAIPSFADWVKNTKIRSTAESLQNGLQMARSEAVRRNTVVRFQLISALDNGCQLSKSGPHWVLNLGASTSPAGACGQALGDGSSPYLLQLSPVVSSLSDTTLNASQTVLAFDGLGRQTATTNPSAAPASVQIDIASTNGSCVVDKGAVRCLRVVVSPGGEVRLCDPARTSSGDPTAC